MLPDALLCVSQHGRIEWIEELSDGGGTGAVLGVEEALQSHGLQMAEVEMVVLEEGFLCPGLVDTHTVSESLLTLRRSD